MNNDQSPLQDKDKVSSIDKMSKSQPDEIQLENDIGTHLFECRSCSYVYDPSEGVKKYGIPVGTTFFDLDQVNFRCPVCRGTIEAFKDIGPPSKASGFEENLDFGFGVNKLTSGQKNVLIFGGLAFALACFLSLYSLN